MPEPSLYLEYASAGLIFVVAFFAYVVDSWSRRRDRPPLPPGPVPSWFNSASLPKLYPWRTYAEWREVYGDLIYIRAFGNPMLILNSSKAAYDLLDKRSSIYSSRPARIMVQQLMGFDWLFSSMLYGPTWRKHRSLFQRHFHQRSTFKYQPVQAIEAHALLRNLCSTPDDLFHHIRRGAAAVVMNISYGHQVSQEGDIYVTIADRAMSGIAAAGIFGTYLVDYIPWLKYVPSWLPGAGFKRQAKEWRKYTRAMLDRPFEMVQERMLNGTANPCFATAELETWAKSGQDPEHKIMIQNVAAISYAAGADTTVSALLSFFLAMSLHPEIQVKAQQQLDAVTGGQRLPQFSDRSALPYIDCIVWECLRWNPVTPLGLIHTATEDDIYTGYFIPKGTHVMANVWNILHDVATYPDPMSFMPERFEDEVNKAQGINDLPYAAFGFGRRMCPGRYLALDTIWINIACVLSSFTIAKAIDKNGSVVEPDTEFTSEFLSRPKPFQASIRPRSTVALELIRETEYDHPTS